MTKECRGESPGTDRFDSDGKMSAAGEDLGKVQSKRENRRKKHENGMSESPGEPPRFFYPYRTPHRDRDHRYYIDLKKLIS